jgi:ribosomal protein S18 acetylase RimI-like enzyme
VTPPAPRRARRSDLGAIASLWRDLLEHHAETLGIRVGAVPASQLERLLRDADAAAWVVEHDGAPAGFCAVAIETAPSALAETGRAVITELYVRPAARRRGAGRALVAAALEWSRDRGALRAEVRVAARNGEGQAFWRALGFGAFVDVLDRRL